MRNIATTIKREPAMAMGGAGAVIMALLVAYGVFDKEKAELWGALLAVVLPVVLPLIQGRLTRIFVTPVSKIEDAGLNMKDINATIKEVDDGNRAARSL